MHRGGNAGGDRITRSTALKARFSQWPRCASDGATYNKTPFMNRPLTAPQQTVLSSGVGLENAKPPARPMPRVSKLDRNVEQPLSKASVNMRVGTFYQPRREGQAPDSSRASMCIENAVHRGQPREAPHATILQIKHICATSACAPRPAPMLHNQLTEKENDASESDRTGSRSDIHWAEMGMR